MRAGAFALGKAIGPAHDRTATLAFTAAGSNLELAAAIAAFGVAFGQALFGLVGPLAEVPVLIGASSASPRLAAALLTSGLFHQLTTVRTEDFDEDAATVAFPAPPATATAAPPTPIPASRLFLRAAACFATLADVTDRRSAGGPVPAFRPDSENR